MPIDIQSTPPVSTSYVAYCDGSCRQYYFGSYAVRILQDGEIIKECDGTATDTTISRMELMGAITAIENVPEGSSITVISDSTYTVKTINQWIRGWYANNWMRKDDSGELPVKNQDLMERLLSLMNSRIVVAQWVKGHSGDLHNDAVDARAQELTKHMEETLPAPPKKEFAPRPYKPWNNKWKPKFNKPNTHTGPKTNASII